MSCTYDKDQNHQYPRPCFSLKPPLWLIKGKIKAIFQQWLLKLLHPVWFHNQHQWIEPPEGVQIKGQTWETENESVLKKSIWKRQMVSWTSPSSGVKTLAKPWIWISRCWHSIENATERKEFKREQERLHHRNSCPTFCPMGFHLLRQSSQATSLWMKSWKL